MMDAYAFLNMDNAFVTQIDNKTSPAKWSGLLLLNQLFEFAFGNKGVNQGFNRILIFFRHFFNSLKLVQEFLISQRAFGQVVGGGAVCYEIGKYPEQIGKV